MANGYQLSGPAMAELRRMVQWWRRYYRPGGGASTGPKFPPIQSNTRFAWATTTAAVAIADATFTVTSIVPFDGSTWSGDDPLTVQNSPDGFAIDSGTVGKIVYCMDSSGGYRWHPFDFACAANCECDVE